MPPVISRYRLPLLGFAAVVAAATWLAVGRGGTKEAVWRLATVDRGDIAQIVSSSGTLNPVVTVKVGSQVSGQISELLADFNTEVKAGQVIARIDPAPFEAKVAEARADLAFHKASVEVEQATVAEYDADRVGAKAAFKDSALDLERKQQLQKRRVVAKSAVDSAVAQRDQARARLRGLEAKIVKQKAQLATARARVQEKIATLRQRELELEHTVIRSPVAGVVISRDIDIGQTVAASLQAPVLFQIAGDLRRMQVELSVDEADIGRVREGQRVRFTVDAYPERTFSGEVHQIRKAPKEVSNVVTYTVVVGAENGDLSLLPGMTANVEVIVGSRTDALRVPNAALRFRPAGIPASGPTGARANGRGTALAGGRDGRAAARERRAARLQRLTEALGLTPAQQDQVRAILAAGGRKIGGMRRAGVPREDIRKAMRALREENRKKIDELLTAPQREKFRRLVAENATRRSRSGTVWVPGENGDPQPVEVRIGLSDGSLSEIMQGALKAGDRVITGSAEPDGSR